MQLLKLWYKIKTMSFKKSVLFGSALMVAGLVGAQTTQRTPMYETFTSSTCPPCAPGNVHLEELFDKPENEGKFVSLKYQMNWPGTGDPYYTGEGGARRGFYGINSVPRLELDGGFDAGPTGLTQEMMDEAYAVESIIELDAYYQVNEATQTVTVQVSVKALQDIEGSGGLFLQVAIFEKLTTGNIKSNGETEFEHVMKKMIPSSTGTYLGSMDADEELTFDMEYTFNGDYVLPPNADSPINHPTEHSIEEFSDLGVAVWVQRSATRELYQSAYAKAGTVSIEENELEPVTQLSVYPNPSSDMTRIMFSTVADAGNATINVFDNAGKLVYEEVIANQGTETTIVEFDTKDLDNGLYFVTVNTALGQKTEKLSVLR